MSQGRDGKMYFGSSSGGTYWSEYDPLTNIITKHPLVDPNNDYVLSISGDSDFVYLQIGQRTSINLWSVNKHNDEKHLLFAIPNTTRFNLTTCKEGIFVGLATDTVKAFKLVKGKAEKADPNATRNAIWSNEDPTLKKAAPGFYFEPSTSQLFFLTIRSSGIVLKYATEPNAPR